jgi:hypothetical protein
MNIALTSSNYLGDYLKLNKVPNKMKNLYII